jgi:hypothetical protein
MKTILFISFLVFYGSVAFSQDFYVTNDGQTVNGSVDNYKEWSKNPTEVTFTKPDGSTVTLTPANCKSFKVGNDNYISYHGTRVANSDNVIYSQGDQSEEEIKDTVNVFLRRVYQHGNYALYKLFDNKRINFYLAKDGNLKELEYYEAIKDNVADPFNLYKPYLYKEFNGMGTRGFQHKLSLLTYKENELINFLADVFKDESHASEKLRNKYPSEILFGIGGNANSGKITNVNGSFSYNQTNFAPSLEFALRIYNQRNFGRLFFQPSLSAMFLKNNFDKDYYKIKATMLNVKLGVGYTIIRKSNFSLYAAASGALPILFNFETYKQNQGEYKGTSGPDDKLSIEPELGFVIGRSLNISVSSLLPFELPYNSDFNVVYKLSQTSVCLRYAFIQKK